MYEVQAPVYALRVDKNQAVPKVPEGEVMAELTDEQFRSANRLLLNNGYPLPRKLLNELAPLLQLPLEIPDDSPKWLAETKAIQSVIFPANLVCRPTCQQ